MNLVTACHAGSKEMRGESFAIIGKAVWSEDLTLPATTQAAPEKDGFAGYPVFLVHFDVDAVIAIGQNPNATTGPRYRVKAGEPAYFYAYEGDRLAARAAT